MYSSVTFSDKGGVTTTIPGCCLLKIGWRKV